jgi:hypothetical protein
MRSPELFTGKGLPSIAYAVFRCCLAAGFFALASFAGFLPAIGISISFWPAAALRGFLPGFFGAWSRPQGAWCISAK